VAYLLEFKIGCFVVAAGQSSSKALSMCALAGYGA
jgi:hypothetical protein